MPPLNICHPAPGFSSLFPPSSKIARNPSGLFKTLLHFGLFRPVSSSSTSDQCAPASRVPATRSPLLLQAPCPLCNLSHSCLQILACVCMTQIDGHTCKRTHLHAQTVRNSKGPIHFLLSRQGKNLKTRHFLKARVHSFTARTR